MTDYANMSRKDLKTALKTQIEGNIPYYAALKAADTAARDTAARQAVSNEAFVETLSQEDKKIYVTFGRHCLPKGTHE